MADSIQYSFVVPIYNDGSLAADFCEEFQRVFRNYLKNEFIADIVELIFVNDGSKNDSLQQLEKLIPQYPFVRVIDLSRNFGQHIALTCGYRHSSGKYIGQLNVDQQDPPDQIPILLKLLESGEHDIAIGLRTERFTSQTEKLQSYCFTWLLNKLTGQDSPLNYSTLRIMNRRFLDSFNQFSERNPYVPALENWLGYRRGFAPIRHQPRKQGRSSYTFRRRLSMAFNAAVSFSDLPLRFSIILGSLIALFGFLMAGLLVLQTLVLGKAVPGYASTISIILCVGGLQILMLGILGIYVGRIFKEVQNRPLFLVNRLINFHSSEHHRASEDSRPSASLC